MIKLLKFNSGFAEYECETWQDFLDFISIGNSLKRYIWRGQSDSSWLLEPSIDRILKKGKFRVNDHQVMHDHLNRFKYATRGRRGNNPPELITDNDWWALGQHFGLATPLLDWTNSPYIAAYFAFLSYSNSNTGKRAVFGFFREMAHIQSIRIYHNSNVETAYIEFIDPISNENSRLISQSGLFTRISPRIDIETWVRENFVDVEKGAPILIKLNLPESEREIALRSLNRMNINHLTLFADLTGVSNYVNFDLEINDY